MNHYDDLIQRLRTATKLPLLQALMNEAADAIEELEKYKQMFEMMQTAGGLWGFAQDGRLGHFPVNDIFKGCKTVRVHPDDPEWTEDNRCSRCGELACAGYDEEPWRTRYCPHCGVKMKNPEETE